jgi:hypothetical protein
MTTKLLQQQPDRSIGPQRKITVIQRKLLIWMMLSRSPQIIAALHKMFRMRETIGCALISRRGDSAN